MQDLNLPKYEFRTKQEGGKTLIFDVLRKKWINLTPEEWVRQNFVRYLLDLSYPLGRIGIEVGLDIGERKLRADGVVYNNFGEVIMLMEFKAPQVAITEQVFAQAADYNTKISSPYVIVSNGMIHYCAHIIKDSVEMLNAIPAFTDICR